MITNNIQEITQYKPALYKKGKNPRIEYYAYNPEKGKLQRIQKRLASVKPASERNKYALEFVKRLNTNLANGWNPFIDPEAKKAYNKLSDAVTHFLQVNERKLNDDVIREETYKHYVSYLKNFSEYISEKYKSDIYLYKINKSIVVEFLEHIYVERRRTAQTRNNYLAVLTVFSGFLTEHDYLKTKFTEGVKAIRKTAKQRTVIEKADLKLIQDYLEKENKYYLLACYVLYYTMIRPKEMSYLKISDISLSDKTIIINSSVAKNRKTQLVSLPDFVAKYMLELKIFDHPGNDFLFSEKFKPGIVRKSEKQFRDYWLKIRKALKLPNNYKFYSLKDTGITDLLLKTKDSLLVRDQARHSSIAVTDLYTPHGIKKANPEITNNAEKW